MRINKICRFAFIIAFFIALNITSFVSHECKGGSSSKVEDFKVRGLYIGMDINDARKIFKEKGFRSVGEVEKSLSVDGLTFEVLIKGWSIGFHPVFADETGKVYSISLLPAIVDKLFNVKSVVDANTYAQALLDPCVSQSISKIFLLSLADSNISNYGISEIPDPTGYAWEYASPIGIYIVIRQDKDTIPNWIYMGLHKSYWNLHSNTPIQRYNNKKLASIK